ncbi:GNAT family N-acetyltransferase [Pseudomonadota bacterium]
MNGYFHSQYAKSLGEFGVPRELPECGGWILQRRIPGFCRNDAMGCYPIFACQHWSRLGADLNGISDELVCVSLVTDPFGDYELSQLRDSFGDVAIPFKKHFVVDLAVPINSFVSGHHRRYAKKALCEVHVERLEDPTLALDDWVTLYDNLVARHQIRGIPAFSRASFEMQFKVPGIVVLQATIQESIVGMLIWFSHNHIAYYHLGAYSNRGYELRASFALFWTAIEYFASRGLSWLSLGSGAGIKSDYTDGLSRFKKGWATGTRETYFCGRIFDKEMYQKIVESSNAQKAKYFPAYRSGEFA